MNMTATEAMNYFFIIHGVPPEFYPSVAYRRAKGFTEERQKIIKCPYCGRRLTSIDDSTKIELYRYPRRKEIHCHEYRKCHACRETVGIVFAPA